MSKALLNYTTTISVAKTAAQIQQLLASGGARAIMAEYDKGECIALNFSVETVHGERAFRLPVDPQPVEEVLRRQKQRNSRVKADIEQAARVAWRIVKDWVEAQLALIETEMVTLDEVMLPYMLTSNGKTVYQALDSRALSLPAGAE